MSRTKLSFIVALFLFFVYLSGQFFYYKFWLVLKYHCSHRVSLYVGEKRIEIGLDSRSLNVLLHTTGYYEIALNCWV